MLKTHDPSDVGSNPSLTKKNLDGNDRPLDGRKTNENNKDSQMGQVTPKKNIKKIILFELNIFRT